MENVNLIEPATASVLMQLELAKAGIPAFAATFTGSEKPKLIGIGVLSYLNNFVVFQRNWYYWVVNLQKAFPQKDALELNKTWGKVVRVDGCAGGNKPHESGVYTYHVDTQEGLNALVKAFANVFGDQIEATHDVLERIPNSHLADRLSGSLRALPIEKGADLILTEINTLIGLSGLHREMSQAERLLLAAGKLASEERYGKNNRHLHEVRLTLSTRYREAIGRLKGLYDTIASHRDKFHFLCDLELMLRQRATLLTHLGRTKEAEAVLRDCRDNIQPLLDEAYRVQIGENFSDIETESRRQNDPIDMQSFYKMRVACHSICLAWLLKRINEGVNSREIASLEARAESIYATIKPEHKKQIDECRAANVLNHAA